MSFLTSTYQAFFVIMPLRGADGKDEDDVLERPGGMVFLTCGILRRVVADRALAQGISRKRLV
jgi:hypothetical protein